MKIRTMAIALLSMGIVLGNTPVLVANTDRFSDSGRVAFSKSPLLRTAITTFNTVRVREAKYYFTIDLPKDAGEPLKKLVIAQRQGANEIDFRLDKTKAYSGTHRNRRGELELERVTQDEETKAITIVFDDAIPPGNTFTVRLRPRRNPDLGGVYLFGVTAFPQGKNPYGLYLGAGRLQFYQGNDSFFNSDN